MQAVRPPPPWHHAAGKFVNDDDLTVFDYVLNIAPIQRMRLDRSFNVMLERPVFGVGDVADTEQSFDLLPTFVGDCDVAVLLVNHIVASELGRFPRSDVDLLTFLKL